MSPYEPSTLESVGPWEEMAEGSMRVLEPKSIEAPRPAKHAGSVATSRATCLGQGCVSLAKSIFTGALGRLITQGLSPGLFLDNQVKGSGPIEM